ncbi:fumarylacetoacetate hydrolase family protein [Streptomyces sp. NPDC057702]|uniref:fumarylacetoacetate hydrolase family protein n=1 Tax=unclassified Streptomyces TaxID=2593676 RepID=UPI003694C0A1
MPHPLGTQPSKIIAVHLNYPCRARERGRVPDQPSYFLKPPSSLAGTDDALVRPSGCELMSFEGEIALVIGRRAHRVTPEQGWSHVAWVTAANDAGAYDLRYADRGSNLRSKGADGFTPIGPRLLDATGLDPAALRLRTWVGGELVQDADTATLLFPFGTLIADLSRLVTLEPGDVILTGTPAGASVVSPGDTVEVEVSAPDQLMSTGRLRNTVTEAEHTLADWGAMPRVSAALRADAWGPAHAPEPALDEATARALRGLATATLSSQLRKRGLQHMTIDGVRPTRPGDKLVGVAHTLRYLPLREDLFQRYGNGMNAQKRAVEELRPGQVLVMDARRDPTSGTIGDILALRAQMRGAAGIVTDGGLRDSAAVADLDLPTYYAAEHPAVLGRRHVPWDTGVPVACGGALVQPGDILVGDADGVVVVPPDLAASLIVDSTEQEAQERFIAERVAAGEAIEGLYPLGPAWRDTYQRWLATQA